jgi:hypothetical protein
MNCKKYDYHVEEDAKKHIREMIVQRKLEKSENFANAREVRNLFEEIITNQARRVILMENPTNEEMMEITMDDLTEKKFDEIEDLPAELDQKVQEKIEKVTKDDEDETAETEEKADSTKK